MELFGDPGKYLSKYLSRRPLTPFESPIDLLCAIEKPLGCDRRSVGLVNVNIPRVSSSILKASIVALFQLSYGRLATLTQCTEFTLTALCQL